MHSPEALLTTLLYSPSTSTGTSVGQLSEQPIKPSSKDDISQQWGQTTVLLNLCVQLVESPSEGSHRLAR